MARLPAGPASSAHLATFEFELALEKPIGLVVIIVVLTTATLVGAVIAVHRSLHSWILMGSLIW